MGIDRRSRQVAVGASLTPCWVDPVVASCDQCEMSGSLALSKIIRTAALICLGLLWLFAVDAAHSRPRRDQAGNGTAARSASASEARTARAAASVRRPVARKQMARHIARVPRDTRPLIVLDAGHGGRDAGAVGASGTLEKAVTLATAQELARRLRATRRYRVVLTRSDDRFVPLPVRLAMSRGSAMLISIHADAFPDPHVRGASVYVRRTSPSGSPPLQQAKFDGTARLQEAVIDNLDDEVRMTRAPARQAHLHVLANRAVPSVLIEVGFLSNRRDEAKLRQARHRATIAAAIHEAIDEHFAAEPRSNT